MKTSLAKWFLFIVTSILVVTTTIFGNIQPAEAQTLSRTQMRDAQTQINRLLPGTPIAVDGVEGPETRRHMCALRRLTYNDSSVRVNNVVSLGSISYSELQRMRSISHLARPTQAESRYIGVDKTCQMTYYANTRQGSKSWRRVMRTSTGMSGHRTPNGTFRIYRTWPGWHTSSLYPSDEPNMYNSRYFNGGIAIHGSYSVPAYPASHGCVRVNIADADYLMRAADGTRVYVYGTEPS